MNAQFVITPDLITNPIYRIRGQTDALYPSVNPEQTETLQNLNITERMTARRRHGFTTYNSSQTASVDWLGLIQETFSNGTELEVVVGNDAKIYTDDGTTRSDVTGTAEVTTNSEGRVRWTLMNDTIFGTDGIKRPWTKTAAGDAAILTSAAQFAAASGDYCLDLVTHRNMLVALGCKESGTYYPTRVRWCDINPRTLVPDPTTWPADNYAEVFYSGGAIVGGVDAFGGGQGSVDSYLLVFKTDGVYPCRLEYESGYIELNLGSGITSFSPLARHSIIDRPDFVWCICKEGAMRINKDWTVQNVIDPIQTSWNALNQGRLQYAVSWAMEQDHQIRTLLSSASNTSGHDRILVYDWETNDVWIDTLNTAMNYANAVTVSNSQLAWYGDTDGYIYQSRVGDDNGTDIAWKAKMVPNDLGYPGRTKTITNLTTYYRISSGTAQVDLRINLNEGRIGARTSSETLGTTLTYNSGLKYNSGLIYPGGATLVSKFFVNRQCETLAPEWQGTGDVEIVGYSVEFQPVE